MTRFENSKNYVCMFIVEIGKAKGLSYSFTSFIQSVSVQFILTLII